MPETTVKFLDALRRSGLLDESKIDSFVKGLPSEAPREGPTLAKKFVEAKLLTKFQADLLLKGRYKGFLLKNKYKIIDLLGSGGMGRVFLCEDVSLSRKVAVKLLSSEQAKDAANLERFYREARAVAALDDPNIVRVHEMDRSNSQTPIMVMEYVDGVSMHDLIVRRGPLTVEQATNFIAQAALGLQHALEVGIIHRDIKPGNLLLDRKGVVKILDLGLARFASTERNEKLTERFDSNSVLGTADYLAPEQAVNSSTVDIRADLYALGGTLFFLLTGEAPFTAPTVAEKLLAHQMKPIPSLRERRSDVSAKLEAVYFKLMAKNPADRYQTPDELIQALSPFADATRPMKVDWDAAGETHPSSKKKAAVTPRSSHRRHGNKAGKTLAKSTKQWWVLGGAVGGVLLILVVVLLLSGGKGGTNSVAQKKEGDAPKEKTTESTKQEPVALTKVEPKKVEEPAETIKLEDAPKYIKKRVTLEMTVANPSYNPSGNTLFLNSEVDYKDPKNFVVVIFQKNGVLLYPETDFGSLGDKFKGKRVRVTGTVVDFKGKTEIVLEQAGQLQILE